LPLKRGEREREREREREKRFAGGRCCLTEVLEELLVPRIIDDLLDAIAVGRHLILPCETEKTPASFELSLYSRPEPVLANYRWSSENAHAETAIVLRTEELALAAVVQHVQAGLITLPHHQRPDDVEKRRVLRHLQVATRTISMSTRTGR
jgi:hypothetical protein